MQYPIPFVHIGLGPIGRDLLNVALSRPNLKLTGVVDIDPQLVGRDVGELLGRGKLGIPVCASLPEALSHKRPLIATHTTRSRIPEVMDTLLELVEQGINTISSTEELLFPFPRYPEESSQLDRAARKSKCTILGTGVNPGFVMDTLPAVLSSVCRSIRSLQIERVVDASRRREPLQRKVGAGLSPESFRALAGQGKLGHVGLRESLYLIAKALGLKLDDVQETLEPVVARSEVQTEFLRVLPGQVSGISHRCRGVADSRINISLNLQMYVGAANPHDRIVIEGEPPVECVLPNGIFGDTATAAILVNLIPRVIEAVPGLKTMLEVSLPRYFGDS